MTARRNVLIGAVASPRRCVALGAGRTPARARGRRAGEAAVMAPRFEVDPLWPKPLPNHWVLGQAIGLTVDAQDHVWIVHRDNLLGAERSRRQPESADRRRAASRRRPSSSSIPPATSSATGEGRAQGYDWPESNHGITVDHKGNVWIGANVGTDAHLLKFTKAGKFLMQFGKPGQNKGSNDTENFGRPAKIFVDAQDQRGLHRRRLRQQARRRHRRRHRQVQALLGRLRQQARRHELRQLRSEGAADQAVPHAGALRGALERRPGLRLRPARTIASRSSSPTARS